MTATKRWPPDYNWEFYDSILKVQDSWSQRKTVITPPKQGRAFLVKKGQVLRISQSEGPQCGDLNAFASENPREHFWSGRTRIIEGPHPTTKNRSWSTKVRPMFTIIANTVRQQPTPHGGRMHDLLFARCTRDIYEVLPGEKNVPNCQENLERSIKPFGLTADYVHDAFNIFFKTGIDPKDHHLFFEPCDSEKGDYLDLYAEMDMIVALSACPCGDCTEECRTFALQADIYDVPSTS